MKNFDSRPVRGMTLIELLVVIGIIGVLIAILLPAVQMARESLRNASCKNNLRQVALACQQYEGTYGHFPAGVTSIRGALNWPGASLFLRCTPYLEQGAVYDIAGDEYSRQLNFVGPVTHSGLAHPIPVFACPSDGRVPGPQTTFGNLTVALTSYLGVMGRNYQSLGGVFFEDSSIRLSQITDGTTQTIILGERPPSSDFWFGWWYAGGGQSGTGSVDVVLGVQEFCDQGPNLERCPRGPYKFQRGRLDEQCDALHFWSPHPGGANFAMADGSVHFLSYNAAADILPKLATRAGAEPVALP